MRVREAVSHENTAKLHAAESKMQELKSNMAVLGKEAAAALAAVEAQQQRFTFQRLVAMVCGMWCSFTWEVSDKCILCINFYVTVIAFVFLKVEAEKTYHQRVAAILDQIQAEVIITYCSLRLCSLSFCI